jgi:hypothetical protein
MTMTATTAEGSELSRLPTELRKKVAQCRDEEARYRFLYYLTRIGFGATAAFVTVAPIALAGLNPGIQAIAGGVLVTIWLIDRVFVPQQRYAKALTTRVISDTHLNKLSDPNGSFAHISEALRNHDLSRVDALLGLQDVRAQIAGFAGQVFDGGAKASAGAGPEAEPPGAGPVSRRPLYDALVNARNKLDGETARAFADISLLERTEAQRTQISSLLAQFHLLHETLHLPRDGQFGSEQLLDYLLSLTHVDKDHQLRPDYVRKRITEVLKKHPDMVDYKPPYVRDYLNVIVGMTFLLEKQNAVQADQALRYLKSAQQSLSTDHPDHGVSSLENALGICYALKMRTGILSDRMTNAVQAHRFFRASVAHPMSAEAFEVAQYRQTCNYIEWLIDVVAQLEDGARSTDSSLEEAQEILWTHVSRENLGNVKQRKTMTAELLEDAYDQAEECRLVATKIPRGIQRPAIFLTTALLGVAQYRYSAALHAGAPLPGSGRALRPEKTLSAVDTIQYLNRAVKLWRDEVDNVAILRYLQGNPVILSWGQQWDSFWSEYTQIRIMLGGD